MMRNRKYKTVFTVVVETKALDEDDAESRAIEQFNTLVGKKAATQIMRRNYPETREIAEEYIPW